VGGSWVKYSSPGSDQDPSPEPQSAKPQVLSHSATIINPKRKIWTYRLEHLPKDETPDTIQNLFSVDGKTHLRVRSLVPVTDDINGIQTQTATMEYQSSSDSPPECLNRNVIVSRNFYGFTPLNVPKSPVVADIIAVTGLAGNAFGSWAHASHDMWLRDILPRDFPDCRVLTYGYGSELHESEATSILEDHSRTFEQKLRLWRRDAVARRPVILIGHSLGCLMIKKVGNTLIMAFVPCGRTLPDYSDIFPPINFLNPPYG
jgi:hypothetical protein